MSDIPFTSRLSLDTYPEQIETLGNWYDDTVATLLGKLQTRLGMPYSSFNQFSKSVKQRLAFIKGMDETEYKDYINTLHYAMTRDGLLDKHIIECFALVYYSIYRSLKMRPYKVQLMAGWAMMRGMLVEMQTGEGKTLAATFPACTAAMARIPVHIITANDYLASRDARLMAPLYNKLGLSVGVVSSESTPEQRREAYACNITYTTSKQLAMDYLRDRMKQGLQHKALRQQLQYQLNRTESPEQLPLLRGLCYAIVDEADSVLIDDARVPLILAKQQAENAELSNYYQALAIAHLLKQGNDYQLNSNEPRVNLTQQGKQRLEEIVHQTHTPWKPAEAESFLLMALRALHLLQCDKDYIVKDNRIELIDDNTGRSVPDRSWQKGLQQMIECKEGCALSSEQTVLARISFQRFFRRYLYLAGMSGTLHEVAGELKRTYGVKTVTIPTRKPSRRKMLAERIYATASIKWQICVKRIEKIHKKDRPILVGTRSIKDSEYLSLLLDKAQLPHQVLNARQDESEAMIIARAGKKGQITIATNMAGRGTDIRLLKEARQAGGLHVIAMELNDARRIDRQLYGRSARQGNRGSCEAILSLEDKLFDLLPTSLKDRLQGLLKPHRHLPVWLGRLLIRWSQWRKQQANSRLRYRLLKWDQQQDKTLAFTGRRE